MGERARKASALLTVVVATISLRKVLTRARVTIIHASLAGNCARECEKCDETERLSRLRHTVGAMGSGRFRARAFSRRRNGLIARFESSTFRTPPELMLRRGFCFQPLRSRCRGNEERFEFPGGEEAEFFVFAKTKAASPVPLESLFVGGEESGYFAPRKQRVRIPPVMHRTVEAASRGLSCRGFGQRCPAFAALKPFSTVPRQSRSRSGGEEI